MEEPATESRFDYSSPEGRSIVADHEVPGIIDQIAELRESDINPNNAVFIGGLMLARTVEQSYLREKVRDDLTKEDETWRYTGEEIGKLQKALVEAKTGIFSGLKEFVDREVDSWRDLAEATVGTNDEDHYARMIKNLTLISAKIPKEGDGSLVKTPIPLSVEEPAPLRIQLQMLNSDN